MKESFLLLKMVYAANIVVAGWAGTTSLFFPKTSPGSVFSGAYKPTEVIRLVGCLWLAIAVLSVAGLFRPLQVSPVLVIQLIYKSSWLIFVALPAAKNQFPYPKGMAIFFLIWVVALPIVIPWKYYQ